MPGNRRSWIPRVFDSVEQLLHLLLLKNTVYHRVLFCSFIVYRRLASQRNERAAGVPHSDRAHVTLDPISQVEHVTEVSAMRLSLFLSACIFPIIKALSLYVGFPLSLSHHCKIQEDFKV
jgi:hypothetical protein